MTGSRPSVMDGWLEPTSNARLPGIVNWTGDVTLLTDAGSFEDAASALVAGWQHHTNDGLIKPILYLYRHATELHLKAAIKGSQRPRQTSIVGTCRVLSIGRRQG